MPGNSFEKSIRRLDEVRSSYGTSVANKAHQAVPNQTAIRVSMIHWELGEISILLKMASDSSRKFYRHSKALKSLSNSSENISKPDKAKQINTKLGKAGNELYIEIKAIHEWLYHLKELMDTPVIKNSLERGNWDMLQKHCEFRRYLVTHKNSLATNPTTVMICGVPEDYGFALSMLPYCKSGDAPTVEIERLYRNVSTYIDLDFQLVHISSRAGFHEKCQVLCNSLDILRPQDKATMKGFMKKYGGVTHSLIEIAHDTTAIASDLLPKLDAMNFS